MHAKNAERKATHLSFLHAFLACHPTCCICNRSYHAGSVSGLWGSANSIEPRLQNRTVVSASDCGCLCQQSSTCIGYMYLGDVRSCWLQNRVNFTAVLEPDSSPETLAARLAVPGKLGYTQCALARHASIKSLRARVSMSMLWCTVLCLQLAWFQTVPIHLLPPYQTLSLTHSAQPVSGDAPTPSWSGT